VLRIDNPTLPYLGTQLTAAAIATQILLFASIIFNWHLAFTVIFAVVAAIPIIWLMYEVWVKHHVTTLKTFSTPLVPLVPLMGIMVNIYITLNLPTLSLLRWLVWSLIGTVFYFLYGIRHSRTRVLATYQTIPEPGEEKEETEL